MAQMTCTYQPSCDCDRCEDMAIAVESADCDYGSCGGCPRCSAELASELSAELASELSAELASELSAEQSYYVDALRAECSESPRCQCDRCDAERELAADAELRIWSSEGRDEEQEEEEETWRYWLEKEASE